MTKTRPGGYEGRKENAMVKETYVNGLSIEQIESYDPYNPRANKLGMVKEWVGRNRYGNAVVFGNTKSECMKEARSYKEI